jgi:hypothetical protein
VLISRYSSIRTAAVSVAPLPPHVESPYEHGMEFVAFHSDRGSCSGPFSGWTLRLGFCH